MMTKDIIIGIIFGAAFDHGAMWIANGRIWYGLLWILLSIAFITYYLVRKAINGQDQK